MPSLVVFSKILTWSGSSLKSARLSLSVFSVGMNLWMTWLENFMNGSCYGTKARKNSSSRIYIENPMNQGIMLKYGARLQILQLRDRIYYE